MTPKRRQPPKDFSDLSLLRGALYCRVSQPGSTGEQATDEKSIDDQEREGQAWAERVHLRLVEVFRDGGSASQFATKDRPGFQRLLELVKGDGVDVVWVWAVDRSQRDLQVFAELRDVFVRHQVALAVNGRMHDPGDYDAWMLLGITSFFGERFSVELSKNVRRGQKSSANAGRPHSSPAYGYRRRRSEHRPEGVPDQYLWVDKRTRQFIWEEPNILDGDGQPIDKSPAWVVREVYRRVAAGETLHRVARDLTDRGIRLSKGKAPTPKAPWRAGTLKRMVFNPAYIGARVYQHDWRNPADAHRSVIDGVEAAWPPLVDEATWWAAHRAVTERLRPRTRPAAAKSLLSCLVTCGACGGDICAGWTNRADGRRYHTYSCLNRRCASIARETLDDYVQKILAGWLADPTTVDDLHRSEETAVAVQARADAARARSAIAQLERDVERGEVTARMASAEQRKHEATIQEAERLAAEASGPGELLRMIGPERAEAWDDLPLDVKRKVIERVADITLLPTGAQDRWRGPSVAERVEWRWRTGPDADKVIIAPPAKRRLTPTETRVLTALRDHGPLLKTELARRFDVHRDSSTLPRLVEWGWMTSELESQRKPIRLAEIAERAEVSQGTVSMVLGDKPGPSASTRQTVLAAVEELGGYDGPRARGRRTSLLAITDAGRQALVDAGVTTDGGQ